MSSGFVFAACVTIQIFGAQLIVAHTDFLRRKKVKRVSLAAGPYGVPEVVGEEARPALRYLGIFLMVAGGAVAGWVLRLGEEQARPESPLAPCTDSIVSASIYSGCPDQRQHIAQVVSHEFDADQLVCVCEKESR